VTGNAPIGGTVSIIPRSAIGNPFLWQGQWFDADAGLVYMRARHYDPITGQFLQRDPMQYEDSVNLYAGMGNNVVSYRDPTGTDLKAAFNIFLEKKFPKTLATTLADVLPRMRIKNRDEYVMSKELANEFAELLTDFSKKDRNIAENRIDNLFMIVNDGAMSATDKRAAAIRQVKSLIGELDLKVRHRGKISETSFGKNEWGYSMIKDSDGNKYKMFASVDELRDIPTVKGYNPVRSDEVSGKLFVDSDLIAAITKMDNPAKAKRAIKELSGQLDHDIIAHHMIPLVGGKINIPYVKSGSGENLRFDALTHFIDLRFPNK
jgi:RHS repeat-associated protein